MQRRGLGKETDHGCCGGEGALVAQKGERKKGAHRETHKEHNSPKPLDGKMRGADFCEFLQPAGLKDSGFRGLLDWL